MRGSFVGQNLCYMAVGLLISPKIMAMIAITNSTCISPAAEYTNTPSAHPMMRTTATIYNNEFIIGSFSYTMFFNYISPQHPEMF
jgi:hypothetical protein